MSTTQTADTGPVHADFNPEHSAPGASPERLAHLEEHSYVIINDFVGSPWIETLREAGRRVTDACQADRGYDALDLSKGYVHRTKDDEPWAIRGIVHPAFKEPCYADFHGSDEFLGFVDSWCVGGFKPEDATFSTMLLWCNPRQNEYKLGWHRDTSWWGGARRVHQEGRVKDVEAYSEEAERDRWEEIRAENAKSVHERNGVSMFLALVEEDCHELIPGSHNRWRTPFEHDVLLPKDMKEKGVPHTPSWNGEDPLPGQVSIRLQPGEALIRIGTNIHTGYSRPDKERNTLAIGWSKWGGPSDEEPKMTDARWAWQLDPAVREGMPREWMKTAWDRWVATQKLGDTLEDRYSSWDLQRIKEGQVLGWRGELEKQAAAAGEAWATRQTVEE
jgi:hypothetical protein